MIEKSHFSSHNLNLKPERMSNQTPSPTIPPPTTTPSEVRTYFSTLLTTHHSVPEPDAKKIASKWQFGRGSELQYYDLSTFREIFGVEAGTVLFGHAKGELSGEGAKGVVNGKGGPALVLKKAKIEKDIFWCHAWL